MIKEPVPVDEERRQDPILLASSGPATSPVDDSTFLTSIYTSRQDARACDACGKPTFLGRVELSSIDAGTFGPMVQGGASACTACALAGNVLPRNERAMKDFLDKAFRSPTGIEMERIAGQLWKENAIVPPIVPRQAKYKASDHRRVIQAIVQQAPARPSKLPRIRVPSNATVIEALMGASSLSVIEARMPCKVLLFKDPLEHVHVAIIPADGREAPCFAAARTITSLHAGAASGGTSISFHPALRSTPHLHITGPGVSLHVKPSRFPSLPISTGAKPPARDAGVARLGTGEPRERGAPRPSPGRELVVQAGKAEIARTHVYEPSTHHVVIEVAWVGHGRQVRLALGDPDDAPLPGMEQLLQRSMDRWMERGHFPDALIRELHVDRGLADERKASEIEATARIIPVRAGVDEIKSLFQRMAAGPLPIVHGGFFKDWIRSPPVNRSVLVIQENRRPSLPLVGVTVAGIPATEGMERNLGIKLFLPPSSSPPPPFLAWGTTCIVPTSIVDLLPGTRVWSLVVYTAGQWPPRVMDACRAIRASYPSIIERSIRTLVHSPRTTQHVWDKAIGVLEDMTAALAALPGMEGAWAAGLDAIERGTASRRFLARIRVERPLRSWIERGVADGGEI
ncbi:MAG: hypothetical protein GYA24_02175 [Candidatus Lokiarchaeota archaeon]|nr:hypothetical protein [Candidatus Lokiarchaeota archaeon]